MPNPNNPIQHSNSEVSESEIARNHPPALSECGCHDDGVVEGIKVVEQEVIKLVIIEEHIKLRKEIPYALAYRIRVDKQLIDMPKAINSGAEIMIAANKDPKKTKLYQHIPGRQPQRVKPEQIVDLRCHGIERFTTMANDSTEGRDSAARDSEGDREPVAIVLPRREFQLPAEDVEYLDSRGLKWEAIKETNARQKVQQWLIIHDWQLPAGYNHSAVSIALLIPPSYSDSQIDMVYVSPALSRVDGKPIGALAKQKIEEVDWQRWSRHRTSTNPWRPGVDDISTHLSLVDDWFNREFGGV